jgi:PilZ domain-containing protein
MSNPNPSATGADWTRLLTDPELAGHIGKLLNAYRNASPDKRDKALIDIMREIKAGQKKPASSQSNTPPSLPAQIPTAAAPPFEPDIFTPNSPHDRRRYPRLRCFVAVELRVEGSSAPIWGNLADTSRGGCFVETPAPMETGTQLEIGLWVANGKLWVKGMVLTGVVTRATPRCGVRIKFAELDSAGRETLREFLKFIESTTKRQRSEHAYITELKR